MEEEPFPMDMRRRSFQTMIAASLLAIAHPSWSAKHTGATAPEPTRDDTFVPLTAPADEAQKEAPPTQEVVERAGMFEGRQIALKRDVRMLVTEETQASASHTSRLPVGVRGKMVPVETVLVDHGRADVILDDGMERGVLLQTKDHVQAITTRGRVGFSSDDERVAIAAFEGPALVGKKGVFKQLHPGHVRVFSRSTGTFYERPLLGAPRISSEGLGVAMEGPAEVRITASSVHGSSSYRVTLMDAQGNLAAPTLQVGNPEQMVLHAPRAGSYWAVVRAVDEDGFAGAPSAPLSVQVLGIKNSDEVVRHGLVFLAPGQDAEVVGQRGLVMRYGTSPEFVPAPKSIGLPGRRATTVEFRDPKDPRRYALFKLAPRLLKTKIKIGPGMGTWPEDTLDLSVRMWDGHGEPLSWMDEYRIVVKVGLNEVPVDWQRADGFVHAQLDPQSGPGPWVVRVSVVDPHGTELARNFLEVAPTPPPEELLSEEAMTADLR